MGEELEQLQLASTPGESKNCFNNLGTLFSSAY